SPQWAALTALTDQLAGHRVGFINDALYLIGKTGLSHIAFHDITSGNNSFDNITGFSAQTGWDAASGWGTPKANVLVPLLAILAHSHDADDM
ncbi:MAG: S53 family peptidase, partial [Ktedonobacteraceae bacterium]